MLSLEIQQEGFTNEERYFYCEQWSYGYKKLHKPFSEKQAEEKHLKGELYTAVIGSVTQPEYVITLREEVGFFSVDFFDKFGRDYLTHQFQKYSNSNYYFLSMAVWRDYITLESHDLAEGYTYFFNENTDDCYVLKEDFINNERYEKTELYPQKDKVILFPKFGEYDLVLNPDII